MPALAHAPSINPAAPDIQKQLTSLTNLNDINRLLHETIARERGIEADLDRQLSRRNDLERNILLLNATTSEVRRQRSCAGHGAASAVVAGCWGWLVSSGC